MPDSVSNSAGIWAAMLTMSPVILFMPAVVPLPVETIVILSTLASGAASARTISGKAGDQFVDDGGLVVFLIRFGFHVHGPGFGFTFLEDDLGFGFTLRARIADACPSASIVSAASRLRPAFRCGVSRFPPV